jgi:pantothenate kinase
MSHRAECCVEKHSCLSGCIAAAYHIVFVLQFRATGGGAYKFAELFQARLGVRLKKEDEMSCLVNGCNFLLKAIRHEAFEFRDNDATFMTHYPGVQQERDFVQKCTHSS